MNLPRRAPRLLAAACALFASGCGKQTFLAVAMLQTPPVPNPVQPSQPIAAQTLLTAYLGTIDTTNPTKIDSSAIAPVTGAKGSVAFHSAAKNTDNNLAIGEQAQGTYELDSLKEPKLSAETDQQYTVVFQGGEGDTAYGAKLLPPPPTQIKEFHPNQILTWTAPQAFTVTRADGPGKDGRLLPIFVTVGQVDPQNPSATPAITHTTAPTDGTALLKFALSDLPYRVASVEVPARAFPGKGFYVVTLLVVRYGLVSDNTFLGSTALTASGDAGLIAIQ